MESIRRAAVDQASFAHESRAEMDIKNARILFCDVVPWRGDKKENVEQRQI